MEFETFENIFVVEMINVDTNNVSVLPRAFLNIDAAYDYVKESEKMDENMDMSDFWSYRVKVVRLYR